MCCTAGPSHVQELAPRADASWVPWVCSACVGRLCGTWAADVVWLDSAGHASCMCAVGTTVQWAALGALLIILVIWMSQARNLYMDKTSFGKDEVSQWIWIMQDTLSNKEFLNSHCSYISGASQSLGLTSLLLKPGPKITLVSTEAVIGIPFCFHQKSYWQDVWEESDNREGQCAVKPAPV